MIRCQDKGRRRDTKTLHTLGGQGRPCSHCGWECNITELRETDVTDDSAFTLQPYAWEMCRMCAPGKKNKSAHSRLIIIAQCSNSPSVSHQEHGGCLWTLRCYRRKPPSRVHTKPETTHNSEGMKKARQKWTSIVWVPSCCSHSRMGKTVFADVYRINETI